MDAFDVLRTLLSALLRDRQRLLLEILALRQQVRVLRRGVTRPKLEDKDRLFWIGIVHLLDSWREALHIVQPETVVHWHREGFRHYWRRKSKARTVGRPTIGWELVYLIKIDQAHGAQHLAGSWLLDSPFRVSGRDLPSRTSRASLARGWGRQTLLETASTSPTSTTQLGRPLTFETPRALPSR